MIMTNCGNNSQVHELLPAINQEVERFKKIVSSLEKKKKNLSDKIKKHEGDVKKAKECSDSWQKCLKTREEKKDSLHKEIKSRFVPCVIKKNTKMFHRCLVCFRKTEACSFKKKQDVAILAAKQNLIKQQFEMIVNEIIDTANSSKYIEKIKQECEKIEEEKRGVLRVFKKIKVIQCVKQEVKKCMTNSSCVNTDFSTFFSSHLNSAAEWNEFAMTADYKEIVLFKQDVEHFYNAQKRISSDLNPDFLVLIEKRCDIIRSYDEKGQEFLKSLEKEAKSLEKEAFSSKIEAYRIAYEQERDEYKKSISTAIKSYDKAIGIFKGISKSPELNYLERDCIKKYSCHAYKDTDKCSALEKEGGCYETWKCINHDQITLQQKTLSEIGNAVNYAKLNDKYSELNKKEFCYDEHSRNHLDHWEASIPDSVWMNILQYEEASNIFDSIKDSIVSIKDGIIFKKEGDVAIAVQALSGVLYCAEQKKRERKKFFIQHAYAVVKEQVAYVEKNKDERMKVCLRGEANTFVGQDLYWVIPEMLGTRSRPDCNPNTKEYLKEDPYSIVDASKPDDFQDFASCFKIPYDLLGESCIDMCNFVPLCQSQCSCVDKDDLKCDDVPCCPQPSCCGQEAGQTCGQHARQESTCNQQNGQEQTGGRQTATGPADGKPVNENL